MFMCPNQLKELCIARRILETWLAAGELRSPFPASIEVGCEIGRCRSTQGHPC